jgi:hypothetical protein
MYSNRPNIALTASSSSPSVDAICSLRLHTEPKTDPTDHCPELHWLGMTHSCLEHCPGAGLQEGFKADYLET